VPITAIVVALLSAAIPLSIITSLRSNSSSPTSVAVAVEPVSPSTRLAPLVAPLLPSSICSLANDDFDIEPAVKIMEFDLGYSMQEFKAYVTPDVSTFYREGPGTREVRRPNHNGWAAKFVNISTQRVQLFWDPKNGKPGSPMGLIGPFKSTGTPLFPRHAFYVTDKDEGLVLAKFEVDPPTLVYYCDNITVEGDPGATQRNMDSLSPDHLNAYRAHVDSRKFNKFYHKFTGWEYLALYPRNKPSHKMWPALYFMQEHWVATKETHFVKTPREEDLGKIDLVRSARSLGGGDARLLSKYREEGPYLNMTLRVISCSPRAFKIVDFLSKAEVDHIMYLTIRMKLHRSTTTGGSEIDSSWDNTKDTRTSLNTWVYCKKDAVIDTIYRRAADLLHIDEALLQPRSEDEYPHMDSRHSLAKALQLVHYDVGQEYTAHHNFGYSPILQREQPARFTTLLLYLNEVMEGRAMQFP
jgi:prolyl 4-hydroxylase